MDDNRNAKMTMPMTMTRMERWLVRWKYWQPGNGRRAFPLQWQCWSAWTVIIMVVCWSDWWAMRWNWFDDKLVCAACKHIWQYFTSQWWQWIQRWLCDYDEGVLKFVPQVSDNEVFIVFNVFRFHSVVATCYACSCKYILVSKVNFHFFNTFNFKIQNQNVKHTLPW